MDRPNLQLSAASLLKPKEACAVLRIQPRTLRDWQRKGTIAFVKIGGGIRFHPDDLAKLIASARVENRANTSGTPTTEPPPAIL